VIQKPLDIEGLPRELAPFLTETPAQDAPRTPLIPAPTPQGAIAGEDVSKKIRARVLVAEDNETNRLVITSLLEEIGYDVDVVVNGQEALARSASGGYAAILMDCQMPVMDGYVATGWIRDREKGRSRIPVIGVTANDMPEDRANILASGMDDYLPKPIQIKALRDVLEKWISTPSSSVAAEIPPASALSEEPGIDETVLDAVKGMKTSTGDDVYSRVLSTFKKRTPDYVRELKEAIATHDAERIRVVAHTLKGSSQTIGAKALGEVCRRLESNAKQGGADVSAGDIVLLDRQVDAVFRWIDETLASERVQGSDTLSKNNR
jgi:CheY-like chemotaxis protein/HPt (histidine-containing phosphotransfer) domain-containing protein